MYKTNAFFSQGTRLLKFAKLNQPHSCQSDHRRAVQHYGTWWHPSSVHCVGGPAQKALTSPNLYVDFFLNMPNSWQYLFKVWMLIIIIIWWFQAKITSISVLLLIANYFWIWSSTAREVNPTLQSESIWQKKSIFLIHFWLYSVWLYNCIVIYNGPCALSYLHNVNGLVCHKW